MGDPEIRWMASATGGPAPTPRAPGSLGLEGEGAGKNLEVSVAQGRLGALHEDRPLGRLGPGASAR